MRFCIAGVSLKHFCMRDFAGDPREHFALKISHQNIPLITIMTDGQIYSQA
jgi:hypothetical protein